MITNGVDIVSIERIEKALQRSGDAFFSRVCAEEEIAIAPKLPTRRTEFLAGRFAAKEAVSKALGTGIGGKGGSMTDIKILRKENGAPKAVLAGAALDVYEKQGGKNITLSISHDNGSAIAFCCIEWKEEEKA